MKLDANALRYLDRDEWRVLTAIEIGQKSVSSLLIHLNSLARDCIGLSDLLLRCSMR